MTIELQFQRHDQYLDYASDSMELIGIEPILVDRRINLHLNELVKQFNYPHSPMTDSWIPTDIRSVDGGMYGNIRQLAAYIYQISKYGANWFTGEHDVEHATTVAWGYLTGVELRTSNRAALEYHAPTQIGFGETLYSALAKFRFNITIDDVIIAREKFIKSKGIPTMNNSSFPPNGQWQQTTPQYQGQPQGFPPQGWNQGNPNFQNPGWNGQPQYQGNPNFPPRQGWGQPVGNQWGGQPQNTGWGNPGFVPQGQPQGWGNGQPNWNRPPTFPNPNQYAASPYAAEANQAQQQQKVWTSPEEQRRQAEEEAFYRASPMRILEQMYKEPAMPNNHVVEQQQVATTAPQEQVVQSSSDNLFRLQRHQTVRDEPQRPIELGNGNPAHPDYIGNDHGLAPTPEERQLVNERLKLRGEPPLNRQSVGLARANEIARLEREVRMIRGLEIDDLLDQPEDDGLDDDPTPTCPDEVENITRVTGTVGHIDDTDHTGDGGVRGDFNNPHQGLLTSEQFQEPLTYREQSEKAIPAPENRKWAFEPDDEDDIPEFMRRKPIDYSDGLDASRFFSEQIPTISPDSKPGMGVIHEAEPDPVETSEPETETLVRPANTPKAKSVGSLEAMLDEAKAKGVDEDQPARIHVTELTAEEQHLLLTKGRVRACPAFIRTKSGLFKPVDPEGDIYLEDYKEEKKLEYKDHKIPPLTRTRFGNHERPAGFYKDGQRVLVTSRGKPVTQDDFSLRLFERLKNKSKDASQAIAETVKESPNIAIEGVVSSSGSEDYQSEVIEVLTTRMDEGVGTVTDECSIDYTRSIHSHYILNEEMDQLTQTIAEQTTLDDLLNAIETFKSQSNLPIRETTRILSIFTKHVNRHVGITFGDGWGVDDAVEDADELINLLHKNNITLFEGKEVRQIMTDIYIAAAEAAFMVQTSDKDEATITELEKVLLLPILYSQYELKHIGAAGSILEQHHPELYDLLKDKFYGTNAKTLKIVTLDNVVMTFCRGLGEEEEFYIVKQ